MFLAAATQSDEKIRRYIDTELKPTRQCDAIAKRGGDWEVSFYKLK